MQPNKIGIIMGITSGAALLLVYTLIMTLVASFATAIQQFQQQFELMTLLIVGFSIQMGLFFYIRQLVRLSAKTTAANSGISTTAMLACCAHHLTDILPFIGITLLATIFTRFQKLTVIVGILSNIVAIVVMLKTIQEHKIYKSKLMKRITRFTTHRTLHYTIITSVTVFLIALILSIGGKL
jgi:hypothetical protein